MRFAVIADIHGNLPALEAVLADLRNHSPDAVLNLGDHLSGPLEAAATADLLMSLDFINIRGNHDRQLVDRPFAAMGISDRAAHSQLKPRHLAWLESLPATRELEPGILLCHGTPQSDLEYLVEEIEPAGLRLARQGYVREKIESAAATLILCGHSHISRTVSAGITLVVNPGSVGLQAYEDTIPWRHYVETGSPHARYAILDRMKDTWKVQHLAIPYDWNDAASTARANGRLDWAHAIATGYALRQ